MKEMDVSLALPAVLEFGKIALHVYDIERVIRRLDSLLHIMVIREVYTGFRHLSDALSADTEEGWRAELEMARKCFVGLCDLDPKIPFRSNVRFLKLNLWKREIKETTQIICAGYYGSVIYFGLIHNQTNARKYIYECTQKFPDISLHLFPSTFFSKDYKTLIEQEEGFLRTSIANQEAVANLGRVYPTGLPGSVGHSDIRGGIWSVNERALAKFSDETKTDAPVDVPDVYERRIQALKDDLRRECDARLEKLREDSPDLETLVIDGAKPVPERPSAPATADPAAAVAKARAIVAAAYKVEPSKVEITVRA